jgi:hypothetical protein
MSWNSEGRAFQVHNKARFENEIMPQFFDTNRFKSFQRSLNLWGFYVRNRGGSVLADGSGDERTIPTQEHGGECYHPHFLRGKPELCHEMQRIRRKTNKTRAPKPDNSGVSYTETEKVNSILSEEFQKRQQSLEKQAAVMMAVKNNLASTATMGGGMSLGSPFASPASSSMSPMLSGMVAQNHRHHMMMQTMFPPLPAPAVSARMFPSASSFGSSSNSAAELANERAMLEAAVIRTMRMSWVADRLKTQQQQQQFWRGHLAQQDREESHARTLLDLATSSGEIPRFASSSGGMPSFPDTASPNLSASRHGGLLPPVHHNGLAPTDSRNHNLAAAALLSTCPAASAAFMDALHGPGRYFGRN